jgi:hypothetical protein
VKAITDFEIGKPLVGAIALPCANGLITKANVRNRLV